MAKIWCSHSRLPRHQHDSVNAARACQSASSEPTNRMLAYVKRLGGDYELALCMGFEECLQYIDNLKTGVHHRRGMSVAAKVMVTGKVPGVNFPIVLIRDISEGYYALAREDGESYDFWRIGADRNHEGEIISWRLQVVPKRKSRGDAVKLREVLLVTKQGASDWASVVTSMAPKINDALKRILVEGDKAKLEYGKREGHCGQCGRPLTDEQSVALGIGPDCLRNHPHLAEVE